LLTAERGGAAAARRADRETRSEPEIELEEVDAGELIYRVRATPADSADGAELADEVVTALDQVSNEPHDG
jgi:hypothetical protein